MPGKKFTGRDRRALRAAFASLSLKARAHWRSKRAPMARKRALQLIKTLAGVKVNPPGPGPFNVAVGLGSSRQWLAGWKNEPKGLRLLFSPDRRQALRMNRLGTARLVRMIRRRSKRLPLAIVPAA